MAELRSEYDDEVLEANEVYMDAMEVLTDPEASQSKINSAKTALAKEDFDKQPEKPDVPTVDVKPGANVDKDGNAKVELTEKEIETMIKNAVEGEAEIIAISPEMDSEATSLEVPVPQCIHTERSGPGASVPGCPDLHFQNDGGWRGHRDGGRR